MNQKTLQRAVTFTGVGIHSGTSVDMTCLPAKKDFGIQFFRTDRHAWVPVKPGSLIQGSRQTFLQTEGTRVATPEHFLAACSALGLTNLEIHISSEELPILDGSSLPFFDALNQAGIDLQEAPIYPMVITSPIAVHEQHCTVLALPHPTQLFTYVATYPQHFLGIQSVSFLLSDFETKIAPARTYGFESEINMLLEKGLAKGGSLDNTLVIGQNEYLNPTRFTDEVARHKLLDLIGDMAVLGRPIIGHLIGISSGHALNAQMVQALYNLYAIA